MSLLSRCVVLAAVVAACQLALVSAVCHPNFVCNTTTLDYTDCACLIDLAVPFNPSDPFSTATGCPTCPSLVGYCPMLNPRRGHVILCHREEADDFADYPTYTPSLPPSSARRARNPAQGQPMDLETYFPPANYSNFHYHMIEVPRREVSDVLRRGAFAPTPGSCCSCEIDLCNARRSSIQLIQSGTDALFAVDFNNITARTEAFHNYVAQMEAVLTEDASSVIESIGVFSPRTVLIEYQLVVSPYGGGSALSLARKPNSLTYLGDVVEEVSCERFNLNVENYLQNGVSVYDFFRRFTFEPNSARVKLMEVTPSCILRGLSQAPTDTQIQQICGALSQLCAMVPNYEFNDSIQGGPGIAGCFQLWDRLKAKQQAMVDGQCNYQFPGTADTSQCRQVHFLSALIDPVVHCPHTNTVSVPCADKASDFPGNGCVFYTGPAPASN